ncbi:MAG: PLP-dependent aminotransferase family protein [Bacillota bacterium]
MDISLDRHGRTPLYLQIRNQIRRLILSGSLLPGCSLPPERKLAVLLNVNRSTVVNAYRELEADGLIESHVGRGTRVREAPAGEKSGAAATGVRPVAWQHFFSRQSGRMQNPLISNILDLLARDEIISFAAGVPSPDFYPVGEFLMIQEELLGGGGTQFLEHVSTAGYMPLREYIAGRMAERGVPAGPENIIVLSGSQQGLDLLVRVLIDPGDVVVIEEPSYLGAIQAFTAAGARILSVPVDGDGMRPDILDQLLSRYRPKFIYTLPTFQNPSGITMSRERRLQLLEMACRHQAPVIEDDPYGELFYGGERVLPLKSDDLYGHVIYLSTFSKVLFPGLRVGWAAAPADVIHRLTMAKQLADLHCNTLSQAALAEFCRRGLLDKHLETARVEYAGRRDAMLAALDEEAPPGMEWNRPAGGYYIWCSLPGGVTATRLLARASGAGVAFLPGDAFYAGGGGAGNIRLGFSRYRPGVIKEGVSRLCRVINELISEGPGRGAGKTVTEAIPIT